MRFTCCEMYLETEYLLDTWLVSVANMLWNLINSNRFTSVYGGISCVLLTLLGIINIECEPEIPAQPVLILTAWPVSFVTGLVRHFAPDQVALVLLRQFDRVETASSIFGTFSSRSNTGATDKLRVFHPVINDLMRVRLKLGFNSGYLLIFNGTN